MPHTAARIEDDRIAAVPAVQALRQRRAVIVGVGLAEGCGSVARDPLREPLRTPLCALSGIFELA